MICTSLKLMLQHVIADSTLPTTDPGDQFNELTSGHPPRSIPHAFLKIVDAQQFHRNERLLVTAHERLKDEVSSGEGTRYRSPGRTPPALIAPLLPQDRQLANRYDPASRLLPRFWSRLPAGGACAFLVAPRRRTGGGATLGAMVAAASHAERVSSRGLESHHASLSQLLGAP